MEVSNFDRSQILVQALPYIQKYYNKIVVIKYGGNAMINEDLKQAVMEDIGGPAENMLFIDDSQKNVDGANAAGLPAVYYEPGTDLAALLADALGDPSIKA